MISREALLAGLHELVTTEEGMMTLYANFSKAMVKHTEGLGEEKKKAIEGMLTILYRDTSRHKEIIDNLMEQVEKGGKNEF